MFQRENYLMKILIWGGKSKAKILLKMIQDIYSKEAEITGIYDKNISKLNFETNVKLFNKTSDLNYLFKESTHFVVAIGGENGFARSVISNKLELKGLKPISLISKFSLLDDVQSIGKGLQTMPGSIIHKFSKIGNYCILNTNSTIDHDCSIGDGVHIMGGSSVAGCVKIGNFSAIGTNATILPNLKIGNNVFIGAGAVVTKDINDGVVVAGVPSKYIRNFKPLADLSDFN